MTTVDPSSPALPAGNAYGVQIESLNLSRLASLRSDGVEQVKSDVAFLLQVCGAKKLYRGTVLPIEPAVPVLARMLEVGSDDASVQRIRDTYAEERAAEDVQREHFGGRMSDFLGWQQWGSISAHSCGKAPVVFTEIASSANVESASESSVGANAHPAVEEKDTEIDPDDNASEVSVFDPTAEIPRPPVPPPRRPIFNKRPLVLQETPFHQAFVPRFLPGVLDDYFFLLSVAAIASDRSLLALPFADLSNIHRGLVVFRFFPSTCQEVTANARPALFTIIDTLLPTAKITTSATAPADLHLAIGRTEYRNEFWLALLEKAYATFAKSYSALNGGHTPTALQHLSGGSPQFLRWSSPSLGQVGKEQLWWYLKESTRQLAPTVATRTSDIGAAAYPEDDSTLSFDNFDNKNWSGGIVVFFAAEYDRSKELQHVDPYLRLRERRLKQQDITVDEPPVRLVKVRSVFPASSPSGRAWNRKSQFWTMYAKRDLEYEPENVTDDDESLVWWMTLDELIAEYNVLMCMKSVEGCEAKTRLHRITPVQSRDHVAIAAPHFLLTVSKSDQSGGMQGDGELEECRFATIGDLKPPPLDFGEESDDEVKGESATSKSSVGETDAIRPNGLLVELRLSLPVTEAAKKFSILLFRVSAAEKLKPVKLLRDDAVCYQFPTFGRIEARPVSSTTSATEVTFYFEAEFTAGFYNLVVSVDLEQTGLTDALGTDTPFEVSCTRRENADLFDVAFEALP